MHPFRWLLTLTLAFSLLTGGFAPFFPANPAAAKGKGGKGKSKPKKSKPKKGKSKPKSKAKSKPKSKAKSKPKSKAKSKPKSKAKSKPKSKAKSKPKSRPRPSVRRPARRPTRPVRRPARSVRPVNRVVVTPRRPGTRVVGTNPFPGFVRRHPLRGGWLTVNPAGSLVVDPAIISPGIVGSTTPVVIQPTQPFPIANSCASDLINVLVNMDVENHWSAGKAVDWRTGDPIAGAAPAPINSGPFVYAVANQQRMPLPGPKAENMIATPLINWLQRDGVDAGWQMVSPLEAQLLANQCWVVVAGWRNPNPAEGDPHALGLAAIVRPDTRPTAEIATRGPRIALASVVNSNDTYVKTAFPKQAWDDNQIVYLAHKPAPLR